MEQDQTCVVEKCEPITERQYRVNQGKWLGRYKGGATRYFLAQPAVGQSWIAIHGAHCQTGKVFNLAQRQNRIEMKRWTLAIEVGRSVTRVEG